MRIEGNSYYIDNKSPFIQESKFKTTTVSKVFDFAYEMSFGKDGEHRKYRSGGQYNRRNGQIFINTFQGKLAELGVFNEFFKYNNVVYNSNDLSKPDFEVYGLGAWDDADIVYKKIKFSVKSTKFYGNLLLLETKDWNENAEYIPNIKSENASYDYLILVRIKEDGEALMKSRSFLYKDKLQKQELYSLIFSKEWFYDIPGYITNDDLKSIINNNQIMPQNALLNGRIRMDAENYYEETGALQDFKKLILDLPV